MLFLLLRCHWVWLMRLRRQAQISLIWGKINLFACNPTRLVGLCQKRKTNMYQFKSGRKFAKADNCLAHTDEYSFVTKNTQDSPKILFDCMEIKICLRPSFVWNSFWFNPKPRFKKKKKKKKGKKNREQLFLPEQIFMKERKSWKTIRPCGFCGILNQWDPVSVHNQAFFALVLRKPNLVMTQMKKTPKTAFFPVGTEWTPRRKFQKIKKKINANFRQSLLFFFFFFWSSL